jgi:hypothetical protein
MTDFAHATSQTDTTQGGQINWRDLLVDLMVVGHLRAPLPCDTKLEAQARWEAAQTIPLLITLLVAGASAVMSQTGGGSSAPFWIGMFSVCALSAITRVGRSYHKVFVSAHIAKGHSGEEAEAAYQVRYQD